MWLPRWFTPRMRSGQQEPPDAHAEPIGNVFVRIAFTEQTQKLVFALLAVLTSGRTALSGHA
jgi:hypothetical protein